VTVGQHRYQRNNLLNKIGGKQTRGESSNSNSSNKHSNDPDDSNNPDSNKPKLINAKKGKLYNSNANGKARVECNIAKILTLEKRDCLTIVGKQWRV
jgi:hypothetical protein